MTTIDEARALVEDLECLSRLDLNGAAIYGRAAAVIRSLVDENVALHENLKLEQERCKHNEQRATEAEKNLRLVYEAFLRRHGCFPIDRTNDSERFWNDAMSRAKKYLDARPRTPEGE